MRKKKFFFSPSSFQKGKEKGKRSFLEKDEKRGKNQGIKPFSPSSTSSFGKERRKKEKETRSNRKRKRTLF